MNYEEFTTAYMDVKIRLSQNVISLATAASELQALNLNEISGDNLDEINYMKDGIALEVTRLEQMANNTYNPPD